MSETKVAFSWVRAGSKLPLHPEPKVKGKPKTTIDRLKLSPSQKSELYKLYETDPEKRLVRFLYAPDNSIEQEQARFKLLELGLDIESMASLERKWSIEWSTTWSTQKGGKMKRTLYQCVSGYDSSARQEQDVKARIRDGRGVKGKPWKRRAPWPFTGCLAHVEVVESLTNRTVSEISRVLSHNAECQDSVLEHLPRVPLHEHVYEIALAQLENDASLTAIQDTNQRMIQQGLYRGMSSYNPETANVRYLLLTSDSAALYSKYARTLGIDVKTPPQYNIADWLDPSSPRYKPEIASLVFHYQERAEAGDRFEVCISTSDMDKTAWRHAHHSQLVLDGTFGVCTVRLLLFIALAVDSHGKGLPIALFLFSAPTGNRATHAGYNTAILEKLLRAWKENLTSQRPVGSEAFTPHSVITDTDTKERGALLLVWPSIYLLLCKFHVRQCWLNNRKKALGSGDTSKPNFWKDHVRDQLRGLETGLLNSIRYEEATGLIAKQHSYLEAIISDNNTEATMAAQAGKKHILYLTTNWMDVSMWRSWSACGRLTVSNLLKIPIEGVVPTTNHLESFNGILKRKHLARWFHSGHRLRFDYLVLLLCTRILPGIYNRRLVQSRYTEWLTERFKDKAGGKDLVRRQESSQKQGKGGGVCWWPEDESRDQQARTIMSLQRVIWSPSTTDPDTFVGRCLSSKSNEACYHLLMHRIGRASCTCLDFQEHGGACKHLRAMRSLLHHSLLKANLPSLFYPLTLEAALAIQESTSSTTYPDPSTSAPLPLVPTIPQPPSISAFSEIQASAQDNTTLIIGDGSGDLNDEEYTGDLESTVFEETFKPPVNLNEEQRQAINAQIQAKIRYEASQLLPRLYGLNNLLGDLTTLGSDSPPEVSELEQVLGAMQTRMAALRSSEVDPTSHVATTAVSPATPEAVEPGRGRKLGMKRPRELRAPSNERRQKRHDSHSTT
ncbi:hypothetical protein PQX77_010670 [Marasmius sp. AFHP31]|nr:hypothetical protein PQX77_010670 [Marasmius sp. AFHP31]